MLNIATTHDGRTPLHVACLEGQLQVIRYLLVKGASPHVSDNHGQTPLHDAIRSANEEAILLLREFGAHLGPTTVDTALKMCSLAADDKVDRLRAWHLAGVDFNVGDYDRRTALHVVSVLFLTGWEEREVVIFGQNIFATFPFSDKKSECRSRKGGERGGLLLVRRFDLRCLRLSRQTFPVPENGKYLIKGRVGKGVICF